MDPTPIINMLANSSHSRPRKGKQATALFSKHDYKSSMFYTTDNNSIETFSNQAGVLGQVATPQKIGGERALKNQSPCFEVTPDQQKRSLEEFQSDFSKTLSIETIIVDLNTKPEEDSELFGTNEEIDDENLVNLPTKILKVHTKKELEKEKDCFKVQNKKRSTCKDYQIRENNKVPTVQISLPLAKKKSDIQLMKAPQDSIDCTEVESSLRRDTSEREISENYFPLRKESEDSTILLTMSNNYSKSSLNMSNILDKLEEMND